MKFILSLFFFLFGASLHAQVEVVEPTKTEVLSGTVLILFGERQEDGKIRRTKEIPWVPGNSYGWDITIVSKQPTLKIKEVLTLPAQAQWKPGKPQDSGQILAQQKTVSSDGTQMTHELILDSSKPMQYQRSFKILPDDPKGEYRLQIYLNGDLASDITFTVK